MSRYNSKLNSQLAIRRYRTELQIIQMHPHHRLTAETSTSDDPEALQKVCNRCPVKRDCRRLSLDLAKHETRVIGGAL